MKIIKTLKSYPTTFWIANSIELIERWAWYGFYMLFANYLTRSVELGGLSFSQIEKGNIMGLGTAILYLLPIITGSIADKFGYKRVLAVSFFIYTSAFFMFPHFTSYSGVFAIYLYLALGAALFKPIISATIAKTTNEENSSVGFGIFYMMVNIGAFFGPLLTLVYKNEGYNLVFYISGGIIALNFLLLIFYKEPQREKSQQSLLEMINDSFLQIITVLKDLKFMIFLIIIAGFWTMYYQLFFTLPVFIEQWVDSSKMFQFFSENIPFIANQYGHNGQMEAEFITNFDAMYIIIFQVFVSALIMKWRPLNAMVTGFIVNAIGMALTFYSQNVFFLIFALLIFGIGEMMGSPKITEYIGRNAPKDKKALYMGFGFIPVFIGSYLAGKVSGIGYQTLSDKHSLVQQLASSEGFQLADGLTKQQYFDAVAIRLNMTSGELTNHLWTNYHPYNIWILVFGIGFAAATLLLIYNRFIVQNSSKTV
ncbi:MAG: MFS transporter [Bacteroidales bacterium]|nr:MFS transporter [Bacteroidales bacterium]